MRIALWIVQSLLAAAFLMAGGMKVTAPIDQLISNGMAWIEVMPALFVRFIGAAEIAGALGLILPAALRIQPRLTPIAASLLSVVMVGAVGTHVVLGEFNQLVPALVLGSLSAFVAWGRFRAAPVQPRRNLGTPQGHALQDSVSP